MRAVRPRTIAHTDTPRLSATIVGRRSVTVLVPLETEMPPPLRTTPCIVLVLRRPPVIGNVKVAPDAVAGATGVTVMWLSASTFTVASEAVNVLVPPVTLLASAPPASARVSTPTSATNLRLRVIEPPFRCSFRHPEHARMDRVAANGATAPGGEKMGSAGGRARQARLPTRG